MKLAYWMYAGPAHIGTLRVASSFKNVHAIMHAPLGDDYFNVMRSMLERERDFTPVTASIVDRHVLARGSQEKVVENITRKDKEDNPDLILITPTCTSSILQEDLQNFVDRAKSQAKCDILLADINHYKKNELQAADRTLEQVVRFYLQKEQKQSELMAGEREFPDSLSAVVTPDTSHPLREAWGGDVKGPRENNGAGKQMLISQARLGTGVAKTEKPSANIIGVFTLGFHNHHDCRELKRLLKDLGIDVNEVIPEGGSVQNLKNLPRAWFNLVPYREVGLMTAVYLEKEYGMPYVATTPMGVVDTAACIREIETILNTVCAPLGDKVYNFASYIDQQTRFVSQAAWFSRSIDCQNLTGKKAVVFGDATHAASMTKILSREMGIKVACAGTYCKHDADWFREQVFSFCDQILITDDHTQVGDMIAQIEPAAIFGTQMERHVGKRLDIPCGVISAPVHIQNFPLGYRPFLGYEGTNQIADLVYNSFSLGMEEHLLEIFGGHDVKEVITKSLSTETDLTWSSDGLAELNKIPGFVRGKVKRNTEKFARQNNLSVITLEVMFAAKEAAGA